LQREVQVEPGEVEFLLTDVSECQEREHDPVVGVPSVRFPEKLHGAPVISLLEVRGADVGELGGNRLSFGSSRAGVIGPPAQGPETLVKSVFRGTRPGGGGRGSPGEAPRQEWGGDREHRAGV
jgi:hypothetical protein